MFSFFKKRKKNQEKGLRALSAEKLLIPYQPLIDDIYQQVGIPHWELIYLTFIHNFAEQVQLLPASESHHHSGPGGLLLHSLEVGLAALKLRKAKMLPVGADAGVIEEQKELWSYAVFTAAMLHDIGKPLTDQIIEIVSEKPERIWNPITEKLPNNCLYSIRFNRNRKYRSHENVALLLAPKLIPSEGMNWITSKIDVLDDWSFALSGRKEDANILGELITQADRLSTAKNLTGADNIQMPAAKAIPLHKRLRTALVYLIDDGTNIPLNRSGAAGWAYDDKLWLVSKRVLDEIKKHMIEEGQSSGIPSDNTRLMDELMQNNIILSSDTDRAVWKVTVNVDTWKNNFTCLCFPMNKLWPDESAWPAQPDNITISITDKDKDINTPDLKNEAPVKTEEQLENNTLAVHEKSEQSTKHPEKSGDSTTPSPLDTLPLPPLGNEQPKKIIQEKRPIKTISSKTPKEKTSPDRTMKKQNKDDQFEIKKPRKNNGQKFVDWFSSGIADGSMPINTSGALVHTVGEDKSLLIVSPLIFRKFAKLYPDIDYAQLQRDFQSLNLHKITPKDTNIWRFKTLSDRRNKKSNILSGMVIDDPESKLNIKLPPGNTHLKEEKLISK